MGEEDNNAILPRRLHINRYIAVFLDKTSNVGYNLPINATTGDKPMCLLIHHTADGDLSRNMIADIYQRNDDGFGATWVEGRKVKVIRTLGGPKDIGAIYEKHLRGKECVLHFRMRTHGAVDMANCHPYRVNDKLVMAHNGVLDIDASVVPEMSDTWHLVEYHLKPLLDRDPFLIFQPEFQRMLGGFIGSSNRLAFMHQSGRVIVINRASGIDVRGMWCSNTYAWNPERFGYKAPIRHAAKSSKVWQGPLNRTVQQVAKAA
jgi:hypothetical protein